MKAKTIYICSDCAFENNKWSGRCPECGAWNTMEEGLVKEAFKKSARPKSVSLSITPILLGSAQTSPEQRYKIGISELDRVLGGGIVKASAVLIGGDPGIGKSTLLLQMCKSLSLHKTILYVSGEESIAQIKLRADRIGAQTHNLFAMAETNVDDVLACIEKTAPDVVIIDSIQTMHSSLISSAPGSTAQVKECAALLISSAKAGKTAVFLVGHVTKEGAIAGPRVLEHMVDCVLYFEGEKHQNYRILRAVKNRFGPTNEIGVFEMTEKGLVEVQNPSKMLLDGRPQNASGAAVTCVMEGSRPVFAEIQALVSTSHFAVPRRMCLGYDYNRASMLIAILEKHAKIYFSQKDVFINIIGGLKLIEPGADLAVILAVASSARDVALGDDLAIIGEVGLSGEIRAVSAVEQRIFEGKKVGFKRFLIPHQSKLLVKDNDIEIFKAKNIKEAIRLFL